MDEWGVPWSAKDGFSSEVNALTLGAAIYGDRGHARSTVEANDIKPM